MKMKTHFSDIIINGIEQKKMISVIFSLPTLN